MGKKNTKKKKKKVYIGGSLLEGQDFLALHFIAQSSPDIRNKTQKSQLHVLRPLRVICSNWLIWFSITGMAKEAEDTQRDQQGAQRMAMAVPTLRPPQERPGFLGRSGHGRP